MIKALFGCRHEWPKLPSKTWTMFDRTFTQQRGTAFVCPKCGAEKPGMPYTVHKAPPNEAMAIVHSVLKEVGAFEDYIAQNLGSYWYLEFRGEVWQAWLDGGEEGCKDVARQQMEMLRR